MRLLNGDANRARHRLDETIKELGVDERYVSVIAEKMGIEHSLRAYTAEESIRLRKALLIHIRRRQGNAIAGTEGRA